MTRRALALAAATVLLTPALRAHHSIYGVYDSSRQATLEGTVAEFQLINPHPFLFIDVADPAGTAERWRLELDNRHELTAIDVTADTFKPGERVRVRGSLARSRARSLYLLRLDRPADGFWYEQVGQSPKGRRGGAVTISAMARLATAISNRSSR
jgi:hypothetical protein